METSNLVDQLSASEAIYGFCGWLTTRPEKTTMSAFDDAAATADLINSFCDKNNLIDPREDWAKNLIYPEVIQIF